MVGNVVGYPDGATDVLVTTVGAVDGCATNCLAGLTADGVEVGNSVVVVILGGLVTDGARNEGCNDDGIVEVVCVDVGPKVVWLTDGNTDVSFIMLGCPVGLAAVGESVN